MAKKNRQQTPHGNTAVANPTANKAQLEKQLPTWQASFENASKVFKDTDRELDLAIDEAALKNVIGHIHGDDVQTVSGWIGKFAQVCGELAKYQSSLNAEYSARWETCNKEGQEIDRIKTEIQSREDELAERENSLDEKENELEKRQGELASLEDQLLTQQRDLKDREINAKNGFAQQNKQSLIQLEQQQQQLEKDHQKVLQQLRDEEAQLKNDVRSTARQLAELRNTISEEAHNKKVELDQREFQLGQREQQLKETELRQNQEWVDLKEARRNLDNVVEEKMERERQSQQAQIDQHNKKIDSAWCKVDTLQKQLSDYEELSHALGDQSAEDFLQQQTDLKQQIRDLNRTLAESDNAELTAENEQLRQRVSELETSVNDMRPQLLQAQTEAAHKRIAATELQAVQQEKRVLEQHKNTLSVHIDDLESRIAQLTDAHKTQTPFPAMSNMDTHKNFRATLELEDVPDLGIFAEELQHRIAQAERVKLYYPIEDIRVLLGGLAMSQLHVFQGISGTGKTSLAKAFAKAVGGFCTDIAVQAGWRDRDDLLGHYNAFERKFYEKDCLQALYQAQTPRWNDTCNVILLDEMNLSRPEQYFSEFLSALEKNDHKERLISLAETALPNAPQNLKDGRQILVPRNVWFIGTANHDETTNELADKTYDRAHVMTLPKQDHRFKINKYDRASFSFGSLQKAFQQASQKHTAQVQELLEQLTNHNLTEQLADTFGLGWGNRFERQAKRFIPVMLACGASEGEALDHLLSTRVMRNGKVTGRYDVAADDIGLLTDTLTDFWTTSKLKGDPSKSMELLNADRQRKERGG
ncbi:MAG: AAA family ATPase [Thalassobium sp.]|nr:MAG: AAA family ATPase [Thalassobium sp.]PHQ88287.1 MAG: AAA family ATPase [Thalassobium sp.]